MIMNFISDMKRKGLSYKDVRRPFFVFKGGWHSYKKLI